MNRSKTRVCVVPLALLLAGCASAVPREDIGSQEQAVANPVPPGLGDHQNTLHFLLQYRNASQPDSRGIVFTTFDQALDMLRQARNFTNGTHVVEFGYGWEQGAAEGPPYFNEDTLPPFDGGFAKYKTLTAAANQFNANIGSYLDTWLAGPATGAPANSSTVPSAVRSRTPTGAWKVGFTDDPCPPGVSRPCDPHHPVDYYAISLQNSISTGHEWNLLDNAVSNAGVGFAVWEDALGEEHIENETAVTDGPVTTYAQERAAGKTEIQHLWDTYGISTMTEYTYPEWQGVVPWFWGIEGSQASATLSTDDQYLNVWKNSVVFMHRLNLDPMKSLAWGSENGPDYFTLRGPGSEQLAGGDHHSVDELRLSFFKNTLQYLYMQKFQPVSCSSPSGSAGGCSVDPSKTTVNFSDGTSTLTSIAATGSNPYPTYSLTQTFPDRTVVLATGGDRFVPQVGAGLKIIAYKAQAGSRTWTLPPTWDQVSQVDFYELTAYDAPLYRGTGSVAAGHQLTLTMPDSDSAFVVVPSGGPVTPTGVMFGTLTVGSALSTFSGVTWNVAGNAPAKIQAPGPSSCFSSKSVAFDSPATSPITEHVTLPSGGIFHGFRIGNVAGTGSVTLQSSNLANPTVTVALPPAGQTALLETNWQSPETGNLSLTLNNTAGANKITFNYINYSAPQPPILNAAESGDGSVTLRFGGQHYSSYKLKVGTSSGNYTSVTTANAAGSVQISNLPRGTQHYFTVSGVTGGVESSNSNELSATPVDFSTLRFDDKLENGVTISGVYGGVDWGTGTPGWKSWAPYGGLATRSIYIDSTSTGPVSKTITLPAGQVLRSLRLGRNDNPSDATITLTSSVAGNAPQTITLTQTNRGQIFKTGWKNNVQGQASTVTIAVQYAGKVANVVIDDLTYEDDFPAVTFEDFTTDNSLISDWYQGIDWGNGSPSWKSFGPFGALSTISAYIDSTSTGPVTKTIGVHAGKVLERLRLGRTVGAANATVLLHSSVPGNTDKTVTITTANNGQMFETGWREATTVASTVAVTVTFSAKALNVGFDDLVYADGDTKLSFEEYPAFNVYPSANRPLRGTYSLVEWGSALPWRTFGPFSALTSTSTYIDSSSTVASDTFTLPADKVLKSVRLGRTGGAADATVLFHSSIASNPDKTFTVTTANNGSVFVTGWSSTNMAASTVTVTVTYAGGAYNVGLDDLVFGGP